LFLYEDGDEIFGILDYNLEDEENKIKFIVDLNKIRENKDLKKILEDE
jgi:hypothetical protein